MNRRVLACVLALLAGMGWAGIALGQADEETERISTFDSRITVDGDGNLEVTETIAVVAAGNRIKRGIYRDFPTTYPGPLWTRIEVPFEIVRVERDGHAEPFHTEPRDNGVRVYVGNKDLQVPPGSHTYRLAYRTGRQLGFFADSDELYWNVTGNGWEFPIESATAEVRLPLDPTREHVTLEGYTGAIGATEQSLTTAIDERSGVLRFVTTRPLAAFEGLTIVASFPKGHVREPSAAEARRAWLDSNLYLLAGAAGLVVLLVYYLAAWVAVGRDPSRGTIIPLFEPPLGLDPAGLRFVHRMGYDERCFSAALVSLGVKGWVRIEEKDGDFTLSRRSGARQTLSGPERRLNSALLGSAERLELQQKNHERIRAGIQELTEGLVREHEGAMFRLNRRWLWPGFLLSIGALFAMGWFGPNPGGGGVAMAAIMVWLGVWTFACLALVEGVRQRWREAVRPGLGGASRMIGVAGAVLATAFALPFVVGELLGLFALGLVTSPWAAPLFLLLGGINWLFSYLLKQPTRAGQQAIDQIEGFRMYLATAEGDELRQAPARTPELFEKMLPYAIALGVEQAWSERFTEILQAAAARGTDSATGPRWYSGSSWNRLGASHFSSVVGSSLSSAISSSSAAPGSRSGSGGGGSSGGGGGGGGGGGW